MQTNKKHLTTKQAKKPSASKSPEASSNDVWSQLINASKSHSDLKMKRTSKKEKKRKD